MRRMRILLLAIVSLGCCFLSPPAFASRNIDRFLSGSWFNHTQNGHGFSLEVSADGQVVIYWYTYHPDGTPTFLLAVGQAEGDHVIAQTYYNTGMRFGVFDPDERSESPWGTITITFHDCNAATVEYNSSFEHNGQPFGSGSFDIERLIGIDQLQCQDDPRAGIYEGTVYSSMDNATYYGFVLVAPDGQFAAFSGGGFGAFGTIEVNGLDLTASGQSISLIPDNQYSRAFSGSGDFAPEYRLFSFYDITGGDSGYGDFYASPSLYRRMLKFSDLAGNYSVGNPVSGFTGSATIAGNGNISGTDELGCHYAGNITIPDTRFNLFEVTLTISTCPGYNATYEGLGSQIDWFRVNDRRGVRVLVTDGNFGFLLQGNR